MVSFKVVVVEKRPIGNDGSFFAPLWNLSKGAEK
jgi:hypothetical protein